jgi:hypothetical protein
VLDTLGQVLRFALRQLRRSAGFAVGRDSGSVGPSTARPANPARRGSRTVGRDRLRPPIHEVR